MWFLVLEQLTNSSVYLTALVMYQCPKQGRVVAGMQCNLTLLVLVFVMATSLLAKSLLV